VSRPPGVRLPPTLPPGRPRSPAPPPSPPGAAGRAADSAARAPSLSRHPGARPQAKQLQTLTTARARVLTTHTLNRHTSHHLERLLKKNSPKSRALPPKQKRPPLWPRRLNPGQRRRGLNPGTQLTPPPPRPGARASGEDAPRLLFPQRGREREGSGREGEGEALSPRARQSTALRGRHERAPPFGHCWRRTRTTASIGRRAARPTWPREGGRPLFRFWVVGQNAGRDKTRGETRRPPLFPPFDRGARIPLRGSRADLIRAAADPTARDPDRDVAPSFRAAKSRGSLLPRLSQKNDPTKKRQITHTDQEEQAALLHG